MEKKHVSDFSKLSLNDIKIKKEQKFVFLV